MQSGLVFGPPYILTVSEWNDDDDDVNLAPVQETASREPVVVQAKPVLEMAQLAALVTALVTVQVLDWVTLLISTAFSLWLHHLPQHPAIYQLVTNNKIEQITIHSQHC